MSDRDGGAEDEFGVHSPLAMLGGLAIIVLAGGAAVL